MKYDVHQRLSTKGMRSEILHYFRKINKTQALEI